MRKSAFLFSTFCLVAALTISSCKGEGDHGEKHDNDKKHKEHKAWNDQDHKAVKSAILDYVEGIYEVDSTRIQKSVDTTLRKIGYWYNKKDSAYMDNLPMTHDQLVRLAARWNKDGSRANENSPKKIKIYDINSKTASAKLTAEWGIDYFHLGKYNGQWKIMNVIWQSMPENEN